MIDIHCHVLPGVDDGPSTIEESLALCRVASAAGTKTIVATPHVNWDYPDVGAAAMHAGVATVNRALGDAGVELHIRPGAEVALSRAGELSDGELGVLRLGAGPYLLVECPSSSSASGFANALHLLAGRGHGIVLAHPERSRPLRRDIGRLHELVDVGMLCCITAASLTGRNGRQARSFAWELLNEGLAHVIASDAHDPSSRPPDLGVALERAGLHQDEIDHFARAVPEAIVNGWPLPAGAFAATRHRRSRWSRPF